MIGCSIVRHGRKGECVRPARRAPRIWLELGLVFVEWRVLVRVGWLIGCHVGQLVTCVGKALGLPFSLYVNLGFEIVVVFIHG